MSRDELSELWHSETPSLIEKEDEKMLTMVIEKTRNFDRRIVARNMREYMAAFIGLPFAIWGAWAAPSPLVRAGFVILTASALWVVYYIRRFAGPKRLDPGASLNAYSQLLRASYEQQIRLLRTVKYWYLLPLYVGILVISLGRGLQAHAEGKSPRDAVVYMAAVTCLYVLIWILNEVYGVRRLERLKRELSSIEGSES